MEKASIEILMKQGDKFLKFCPYCGKELEHRWQHISYDDANPVRLCEPCNTAWIWQLYNP